MSEGEAVGGIIYVTEYLEHEDGVRYFCLKGGYSVLLVMFDGQAILARTSRCRATSAMTVGSSTPGTASGASPFAFPPPPTTPRPTSR